MSVLPPLSLHEIVDFYAFSSLENDGDIERFVVLVGEDGGSSHKTENEMIPCLLIGIENSPILTTDLHCKKVQIHISQKK